MNRTIAELFLLVDCNDVSQIVIATENTVRLTPIEAKNAAMAPTKWLIHNRERMPQSAGQFVTSEERELLIRAGVAEADAS